MTTPLPYEFDLCYDIKTMEQLLDHLGGRQRTATSATDAQLIALARAYDIALPLDVVVPDPAADLEMRHAELLGVLRLIHEHAKPCADAGMDSGWIRQVTAEALQKNGIVCD